MKIFLMADYPAGYKISKYLIEKHENIVGLAVHPKSMENKINKGYTKKIIEILKLPKEKIFQGECIHKSELVQEIKKLNPDIILTIYWGFILKSEIIKIPLKGCINIHLAYLPFNRGKNPNVWPILDGTPAGVTMHYIDSKIDTGDIISQMLVPVESIDTGESLYRKLEKVSVALFIETWSKIKNSTNQRIKQDNSIATLKYSRDFEKLNIIDVNKTYTGKKLIDILRAKTFPPNRGVIFIDENGKKIQAKIQLEYIDDK